MVNIIKKTKKMELNLTFGQWLRLRRESVPISQVDLAKALNVTSQTIRNWEKESHGMVLNPVQMLTYCEKLNLTLEDLAKVQSNGGVCLVEG